MIIIYERLHHYKEIFLKYNFLSNIFKDGSNQFESFFQFSFHENQCWKTNFIFIEITTWAKINYINLEYSCIFMTKT
jgi:hypothetical protein